MRKTPEGHGGWSGQRPYRYQSEEIVRYPPQPFLQIAEFLLS